MIYMNVHVGNIGDVQLDGCQLKDNKSHFGEMDLKFLLLPSGSERE